LSVFNSGRWGSVIVSMALISHACVPSHEWKSLAGVGRGREAERKKEEQKERKVVKRDQSS